MKRDFFFGRLCSVVLTVLIACTCFPAFGVSDPANTDLLIIHTNDLHGRVTHQDEKEIGYALIAAQIETLRQHTDRVLVLDAGDTFHGTVFATLQRGESIVEIMNAIGYDVMVPGNHDFNYGTDRLLELAAMADFPLVAANLRTETGPLFPSYTIIDFEDMTVAVFGLVTTETYYKSHPKEIIGLEIEDPIAAARRTMADLTGEEPDLVIALVHLGLDLLSDAVTSRQLAEEVTGIDLIVDGHSHQRLPEGVTVQGTLIVQAGYYGRDLGLVRVSMGTDGCPGFHASLLSGPDISLLAPQPEVEEIINHYEILNAAILDEVVSYSELDLVGDQHLVRTKETSLGKKITQAMLASGNADVALINGGSIRDSIAAGPVTRGDILSALPFDNTVVVIEVNGADLVAMLENGLAAYPEPVGRFPQVSGLTYVFDPETQPGNRTSDWLVGDEPLDLESPYRLITNDFLAAGGDEYSMLQDKPVLFDYGITLEALFADFLINQTMLVPVPMD